MENKGEEIIGYRIGQGLFCVECYKEGAKTLKAVKNPEDPEIKFLSRPITAQEVKAFTCKQCKAIKGPSARELEIKIQERKNLIEFKIKMVGEVSKMSHRAKLIKRNLDVVCQGRPLSRKSMLTLRRFFDGLGEKIDLIRGLISNSVLDDIFSHC
jgi:hypothetical protein